MTNRSPRIAAMIAVCSLGMVACDSPTSLPTRPTAPGAASRSITVQSDLGTEIQTLIATGFPKGQATAIGAMWDKVLRDLAKEPKTTLKGKVVPGNSGRSSLAKVASYIKLKTGDALPPSGETQAHFAARLVLDMSLYVYGGPATTPPVLTTTSDVALELVQPGVTTTVVTPAKLAAVVFPSGAVAEPTVVVITPDPAYYPTDCTGPLDTQLCQYPLFYHFNVFPDVKLGTPAKVQVCHVDAGSNRLPIGDHDGFRLAHEKPVSLADKSAGSTIVGNVEVLALAAMNVTNCPANGGTIYNPPVSTDFSLQGRLKAAGMLAANGIARAAKYLFVPKDVYAIDIGGGGFAEFFSTFGVVDPHTYSLNSGGTIDTPHGGGLGGSAFSFPCPSGSVGTGMLGNTKYYDGWTTIFQLSVQCAELLANGSLGTTSTTSLAGNFVGDNALGGACSGGQLLMGGTGHQTGYPDRLVRVSDLTGSCGSLGTVVAQHAPQSFIGPLYGLETQTHTLTPFSVPCPQGSVVTGLQGRFGDILDAVGFQCTPVVATLVTATPVSTHQ
jgi:hypothetical protein